MSSTPSRKKDHVELCINEQVTYEDKSNGLERWEFLHNALPEIDADEIDTGIEFLGYTLSCPLLITGMTGGYEDAERINAALADLCQDTGIALGAGSMRQALENDRFHDSWRILRRNAPGVPILANIGAVELASMQDSSQARFFIDMIQADALVVHTNPLQEFLQPEGEPRFRGVLKGLEMLCATLDVPVILKEVGSGISVHVARRAYDVGVRYIDVSGAGGTSWAGVELLRRNDARDIAPGFREWGIPTAEALVELRESMEKDLHLIASGGITDGLMVAKCIALGADLAGAARPLLTAFFDGGVDALHHRIFSWKRDLIGAMFLVGAQSIQQLRSAPIRRRIV